MPERFDLTSVTLREYRSIARCHVALRPFNLLVGPNGSGKSNFVDSLRLVSQSLNENLDNALRERGGVAEVRRRSTGHPRHFGIGLSFRSARFSGEFKFQIGAVAGGDYRVTRETCRVNWQFERPDSFYDVREGELVESSMNHASPRVVADRLFLVAVSGLPEFRPVFDGLAGVNVFNMNPDVMREPQKPDPGDLLRRDGSNVASVLETLRRTRPDLKAGVEDYLRRIVPGIESADRLEIGAWETLAFRQLVAGSPNPWSFQSTSMSDGTLRALGVLVALFAVPNGSLWSPVAIEEPESALHPAAAGYLFDALQTASELRQVIATTHSPELLDSEDLDPRSLLSVRADDGKTVIAPVNGAGIEAIRSRLFTAGELHRLDQLDPEPSPDVAQELF